MCNIIPLLLWIIGVDYCNSQELFTYPLISQNDSALSRPVLTIAASFSTDGGWYGGSTVSGAMLALEHINNRSNILSNYTLTMNWGNTKVSLIYDLNM